MGEALPSHQTLLYCETTQPGPDLLRENERGLGGEKKARARLSLPPRKRSSWKHPPCFFCQPLKTPDLGTSRGKNAERKNATDVPVRAGEYGWVRICTEQYGVCGWKYPRHRLGKAARNIPTHPLPRRKATFPVCNSQGKGYIVLRGEK